MEQNCYGYVKRFVEHRRRLANVRALQDALIGIRDELGDRERRRFIGTLITDGTILVNDQLEVEVCAAKTA